MSTVHRRAESHNYYTLQTRLVRTLCVNCQTARTVSPYTAWMYTRSLFMSIVHRPSEHTLLVS